MMQNDNSRVFVMVTGNAEVPVGDRELSQWGLELIVEIIGCRAMKKIRSKYNKKNNNINKAIDKAFLSLLVI